VRLARFLAAAGVASRRKAEECIRQGRVSVNGQVVTRVATEVDPGRDRVTLDGRPLQPERRLYVMLNKPAGYVSTVHDPQGRPTVLDLLPDLGVRLFPVGRLDLDTEGLLLLTNDGGFSQRVAHPRHQTGKVYEALVQGRVDGDGLQRLLRGVMVEGTLARAERARIVARQGENTVLEICLHEGRKRQVRRMCAAIGHPVLRLRRTAVGPLTLGGLRPGEYRLLSEEEVESLLQGRRRPSRPSGRRRPAR
jgi:pseudouridine synthase